MATNPVPKVMWVSPPGVTSIPCELPLKNQNVTDTCATRYLLRYNGLREEELKVILFWSNSLFSHT